MYGIVVTFRKIPEPMVSGFLVDSCLRGHCVLEGEFKRIAVATHCILKTSHVVHLQFNYPRMNQMVERERNSNSCVCGSGDRSPQHRKSLLSVSDLFLSANAVVHAMTIRIMVKRNDEELISENQYFVSIR